MNQKYVIVVQAKEDEMAKFAHALMYANEFHAAGYEVKVIFDGASVKTLAGLDPEKPVYRLYETVRSLGLIEGVCEFCINTLGVAEAPIILETSKLATSNGHASLVDYVSKGYTPLVL